MFEAGLAVVAMVTTLGGQTPARPQFGPVFAGDCSVSVVLSGQRPGDVVQVLLDFGRLEDRRVAADSQNQVEVPTGAPLQARQTLRLAINGSEIPGATVAVAESSARPAGGKPAGVCTIGEPPAVEGESFVASSYFGWAYDQFAPDSVGGYPAGTATAKHNRMLFGVDFDYRLFGSDSSKVQLWVAGETLHGVRSADIDCSVEENKPPVCTPQPGVSYARAVLENQSSLEAYAAPRIEFANLQKGASTPATLYVTGRLGFIAMAGAPRVFKNHHVGIGLLGRGSAFEGSYLEAGVGMNELMGGRKFKRLKIDGFLTFALTRVPLIRDIAFFLVKMLIDNDLGLGADSIQTFLGFDIDVRKFFGAE
jgi:hypothetical protein